jgi:methanesulfonate monooxygenase small subunit
MSAITREACAEVLYRASLALDRRDWPGFLQLCAPDFHYRIGAYSPEIRREMIWLDHDRAGLAHLFETLPRHNSDQAPLTRHLTLYTTEIGDDHAETIAALQVFRTDLDGGATEIFAVGKVHDRLRLADGRLVLASRLIQLDTRRLGIGSHVPF